MAATGPKRYTVRAAKKMTPNDKLTWHLEGYSTPHYISPGSLCKSVKLDNSTVRYVMIKRPEVWYTPQIKLERKANINSRNPIYSLESLVGAPKGIYIWIWGDKGIFAVKVRSLLEFGTKHMQLAYRTETENLTLAGELELKGEVGEERSVNGNILSGTYIGKLKEKFLNIENESFNEDEYFKEVLTELTGLFSTVFGDKVEFDNSLITKITEETTPITLDELALYKSLGYRIYLFTEADACLKYEQSLMRDAYYSTIGRPLTEEEQGYLAEARSHLSKVEQFGGRRRTRRRT
jgi:hypothetical protein